MMEKVTTVLALNQTTKEGIHPESKPGSVQAP